ncbi:protein FAR1-RELATED SEQUENCE 5-like [Rosa rugosa]|uniref:protein FAR1-RELATED SEQUENCE 5-like n=1 Tax=Rosa rugosa TaxID=74645 RepID=UPI002B40EF26|nr:protein FAR1-RELATED SEQUENCE 5-like [Rosa rugosa]
MWRAEGIQLILNTVVLVGTSSQTMIGRPIVPDAAVHAVVEEHVSMDTDEGGLRYNDHIYHETLPSDEDESEDEMSIRFGKCTEVTARSKEATGSGKPAESTELRKSPGIAQEDKTLPDVGVERPEFVKHTGAAQLNGKHFEDLTMDDMKAVYFPTVQEAEKFLSLYSRILGFSIRRDRLQKEGNDMVVRRQWVCSKQGLASMKSSKHKGVDKNKFTKHQTIGEQKKSRRNIVPSGRRYTRVNCQAAFSVRYCKERELYRVTKFIHEHNHELAMSHEVECLRRAQVYTSRAYEHLVEQAGGHDGVGFIIKDLYNKIAEKRKNAELDGDAQAALTWMNMRGMESQQFCCKYSLDEEGRLANLFWRDYQSFLDYSAYGDVVIMDSTYKTNMYVKPLVVFVGCNNHRATVVFGFALIRDEREDTYTWVFKNFLESMEHKQPSSILTDGDESIRNVVERMMPQARHKLCAWHIGRNIGQNVKDAAAQKTIGKLIYSSMTISEWEAAWHSMVVRNGLSDNA